MKPILFLLILVLFYSNYSCKSFGQDATPEAVKQTFKSKYPNENDPDWHTDKNGNYESHFKIDGISYRADFDASGQWIETESNIKKKELPEQIQKRIKSDFKEYKITEIEQVDHYRKGRFYDVEFKVNGKKKDIEFDKNGQIIND